MAAGRMSGCWVRLQCVVAGVEALFLYASIRNENQNLH